MFHVALVSPTGKKISFSIANFDDGANCFFPPLMDVFFLLKSFTEIFPRISEGKISSKK